ncbi:MULTISPECIES: hypothetical protein [Spirulina sp. CCY15215]|uniref:hypothetical protein n=1 Tax=Spirulina sp. CCY15215 TaxID=2767591 RepID=UPI00194ED23D|nr:hypothetical protein [Spirulina major]
MNNSCRNISFFKPSQVPTKSGAIAREVLRGQLDKGSIFMINLPTDLYSPQNPHILELS